MKKQPTHLHRFCYFLFICFGISLVTTALWAQEHVKPKSTAESSQQADLEPEAETKQEIESNRPAQPNTVAMQSLLLKESEPTVQRAVLWLARTQALLEKGDTKAVLGVHVRSADETLRAQLRLSNGVGLVVEHVTPDSAASDAKLQEHDVLVKFDNQILFNEEQLRGLIEMQQPDDEIELTVVRQGAKSDIMATLRKGKPYEDTSNIELFLQPGMNHHAGFSHKMLSSSSRCVDCHVVDN